MKKSFNKYEKAGLPGGPNELKRFTSGFIISERGQWDYPGQPTAVPTPSGRITMKGVEDDLLGIDNLGNTQYMTPGNEYQFEGDMVYEIPQAKKGGSKKPSKKYSKSLMAKNRLFDKNPLLKKSKSVKNKIFDPNSPYFQPGGELSSEVGVSYLPKGERSYYDPRMDNIYLDPNASEEELYHEMAHAWQNRQDGFRSDPYSPKLRPSIVASDEQAATYFNRKGDDVDRYLNNLKTIAPEFGGHTWNKDIDTFMPEQLKYDKVVDPLMYSDPTTLEGEAEYMSQVYGRPPLGIKQEGGFMDVELDDNEIEEYKRGGYIVEEINEYKKGGALLTKKVTCKNCGWSWDAADGGNDLTTCHKCGGQGLIHAQNGGYINDISVPQLTKATYGYSSGNLIRKDDGGSVSGTQGLTDAFSQRLTQMILDAKAQGIDLNVGSGYRSYEKQKKLWEQALKKYGSPEKARKWVAPPGGSFHNKGLAVDLHSSGNALGKEKNSKATDWAHANAKKYGLHFRMGHEPWHIEPIETSKSGSGHDHHDDNNTHGNAPDVTTKEEMDLILKNKEIELKEKQQLLAEQEKAMHDDDYSDWEPAKKQEVIDPRFAQLEAYSKIITPSIQNINQQYRANLQNQMRDGGFIMELTDAEIKKYRKGGYIIEELPHAQGGLEQKTTIPDWQSAPKTTSEVFAPPPVTTVTEETVVKQPIFKEEPPVIKSPTLIKEKKIVSPVKDNKVITLQLKLKKAGYDLGKSGASGNGVDGIMGNKTKVALDAFNAGIPPSKIKVPDPTKSIKGQTKNYNINTNLKDGYLPYLDKGEETCVKGKGCSANVSIKMGSLLGNITDKSLWANDAWFNKSDILNKGGDLIYENKERDYTKMQKVPKDVWSKLQVGDYVQLNRKDTASSARFASQTKAGLKNEGIEHLGFVVGKDKDGTPLIWHGSETGKAYVQRIDQPLALHDENKISGTNNFTYQVASIVRSPHLKDKDLTGLQNTGYYSPLDLNKKLVPKKGSTETQRAAVDSLNKSVGKFKSIGYKQDDVNYVAQILIGGIMQNETQGGTSNKRIPKEIAATIWKNYLGQGNFEGDEASVGYYQLKPHLNFTDKDGKINALGKKLEKLGMSVDDIGSNDINLQTKAGTLLLLDAYSQLKKDKDFNPKTGLYKNKIPASYILAKSWQAGAGWYKKDKYKKYLNNFDVDYSNNALKNLKTIGVAGQDKTARDEYIKYVLPKITKIQPKVYTFPEKKGVKYKKDNFGNWYINEGSKFVKINDPKGVRRQTLNAWDKKYNPPKSNSMFKTGGFVMELDDNEIKKYLDGGYIIEEIN